MLGVPALSFTAIETVDLGDNCISATSHTSIARADMQRLTGQLQLFSSTNTVLSTCNIIVNSEVAVTITSQISPCIEFSECWDLFVYSFNVNVISIAPPLAMQPHP